MEKHSREERFLTKGRERKRKKKVTRGRENERSENARVATYDPIFDKDNVLFLRTGSRMHAHMRAYGMLGHT